MNWNTQTLSLNVRGVQFCFVFIKFCWCYKCVALRYTIYCTVLYLLYRYKQTQNSTQFNSITFSIHLVLNIGRILIPYIDVYTRMARQLTSTTIYILAIQFDFFIDWTFNTFAVVLNETHNLDLIR